MKSFKEFRKSCNDLMLTCRNCDYCFEFGLTSDEVPFCKIYAHKHNKMLGHVLFESIPSDATYFVSIDIIREVPYIYIYPINPPFKSCL